LDQPLLIKSAALQDMIAGAPNLKAVVPNTHQADMLQAQLLTTAVALVVAATINHPQLPITVAALVVAVIINHPQLLITVAAPPLAISLLVAVILILQITLIALKIAAAIRQTHTAIILKILNERNHF